MWTCKVASIAIETPPLYHDCTTKGAGCKVKSVGTANRVDISLILYELCELLKISHNAGLPYRLLNRGERSKRSETAGCGEFPKRDSLPTQDVK